MYIIKAILTSSALVLLSAANPVPVSKPELLKRVVNGNPTTIQEFPYAAFISSAPHGLWNTCGGTLIAPNMIITLASCLLKLRSTVADPTIEPGQLSVLIGSERENRTDENTFTVSKFILYPGYKLEVYADNIGLVVLERNVPLSLASPVELYDQEITDDLKVRAVGWGATNSDYETYSKTLNYVDLDISSDDTCAKANNRWDNNNGMNICTKNKEERGVCFGDFGGPLLTIDTDPKKLVGIINMIESETGNERNVKCATVGALTYHTSMRFYATWIREQILANTI